MRTTLDLNDELLRQAKERALKEGQPLRAVVEDALRRHLKPRPASRFRLKWGPPVKGKIQPGVDLSNRSRLLDLMDGLE
jgi:hypothetical protein